MSTPVWLEPGFRKGMQWAASWGQVVEAADQGKDTAVQEDALPMCTLQRNKWENSLAQGTQGQQLTNVEPDGEKRLGR